MRANRNRRMMIKESQFFKIKQVSEYDRQYKGNKITYLLFPCGPVPNDPWIGTGPQPGRWGPLV